MTAKQEEEKHKKEIKMKEEKIKKKQAKKEEYKKLSEEEKTKIRIKQQLQAEWPYIEKLVKNKTLRGELKKLFDAGKIVVGDPGKRTLLHLRASNGKQFVYNNRRRVTYTKRLKTLALIQNRRKKSKIDGRSIEELDNELTVFSGKTTYEDKFLQFIQKKTIVRDKIMNESAYHRYLLKHRWHSYLNRRRHEELILNDIQNTFGKDAVYIIGDWNEGKSSPLRFISTPGIGMRRLLRRIGQVFLIDEFRTSTYRSELKEKLRNLVVELKGKRSELHSVLTYPMSNRRIGCINRDNNSARNMIEIVRSLLSTGKRPAIFDRKSADPEKFLSKKDKDVSSGRKARKSTHTWCSNTSVRGVDKLYNGVLKRQKILLGHKTKSLRNKK